MSATLTIVPVPAAVFRPQSSQPRFPSGVTVDRLLAAVVDQARHSPHLRYAPSSPYRRGASEHVIPHFVFNGPPAGGEIVRLGLFAGLHGDEPEGAIALLTLLQSLQENPALAAGYQLHVYPVCNPSGLRAKTRCSCTGLDLNREFWRNSTEPEVWWLEHELLTRRFQGLVSLHADDTAEGVYAYARGAVMTESLARPALEAARRVLPVDARAQIDGFYARDGLLFDCYEGILSAPPAGLDPQPFEIILETPQSAPTVVQVQVGLATILAILEAYRGFLGYQDGI